MEDILLEVLTETLNISPEELTSALKDEEGNVKDDAKQAIVSRFTDHIAAVKSNAKKEGKGWGEREALSGFEKQLAEKFELTDTDNLKGIELINKIVESKTSTVEKSLKDQIKELEDSKGFTEEDIKKSSAYIELENALTQEKASKEDAVKEAVSEMLRQRDEEVVFSSVVENGLVTLEGLNPILSEDPAKKKAQVNDLFVSELSEYRYSKLENGEIVPLDKESGNRLENKAGHALKMEDLYKSIAERKFDFKKSKDKRFGGDDDRDKDRSYKMPATEEEYFNLIGDSSIPIAERTEVAKLYDAKQLSFQS